ncbi:MAG: cytochrome c-type biogenesis protein CcmH/NrfF [Hyphomicrobiaceae bacterium]|jgi:cytochrome c-type biogenesis protein CcmH/NrfF
MRHVFLLILAPLLFVVLCTPVDARDFTPEVEREAAAVFHSVMSPFCPGKLIANCPSPKAVELREEVRTRISDGESGDAIREELFASYGDAVRAAPRTTGFGLVAWILPFAFVLSGVIVVLAWYRRQRAHAPANAAPRSPLSEESRSRLDRELDDMD